MKGKKIYLYLLVGLLLIGMTAVVYAAKTSVPIESWNMDMVPEFSGSDFNAKARIEDTKQGLRVITLEASDLKSDCSYGVYLSNPRNGDREFVGFFLPNEDGWVIHRFIVASDYKSVDIYAMGQKDTGLQTFDYTHDPHQSMWSSGDYFTAPSCTAAGRDIKILSLNLEGIK